MPVAPLFTVTATFRRTYDVCRFDGGKLLGLALLLFVLPTGVFGVLLFNEVAAHALTTQALATDRGALSPQMSDWVVALTVANVIVFFAGNLLANAAMLSVAYEGLQGRRASLASGTARALRVLPANIGLAIVCALGICLASLLLVVPGLILWARWSVALPALVIERTGVMESLARSRDLTQGRRWTVLGFVILMAALNGALFAVIVGGGKVLGKAVAGEPGAVMPFVVNSVATAVTAALAAASATALYVGLAQAAENETGA